MLGEVHGACPGRHGRKDAVFRDGPLIERPGQAAT